MPTQMQSDLSNLDKLAEAEQARFSQYHKQLPDIAYALNQHQDAPAAAIASLAGQTEDLAEIKRVAEQIRTHSESLVVLGTGGSSLGGQALYALNDDAFDITFYDNVDPHTMQQALNGHDWTQTHLLIISKSGSTLETVSQALCFIEHVREQVSLPYVQSHTHIITMAGERPLRLLADHYGIPVLEHPSDIGGRYSVLSIVGLLPAAVANIDIDALRKGAASVVTALKEPLQSPALLGAAWQVALMPTRPLSVLMPYSDRLTAFAAWYQQLWAESLGKKGLGSTPVAALGAVDQHSQLQLYLDGPKDKLFTFIALAHAGKGSIIPGVKILPGFDELPGQTLGDVMQALQTGTIDTIKAHDLPVRELAIDTLNSQNLGMLLMHFMVETIAAAKLLEVNAFDQPAVEDGKMRARAQLQQGKHCSDVA